MRLRAVCRDLGEDMKAYSGWLTDTMQSEDIGARRESVSRSKQGRGMGCSGGTIDVDGLMDEGCGLLRGSAEEFRADNCVI